MSEAFPITGTLRLPLLIVELIFLIICFDLGATLFSRYIKTEKTNRNIEELGYSLIFLGFFLMTFFYIISEYYSSDVETSPFLIWKVGSIRYLFLNAGYFTMFIVGIFFLYCIEKGKVYFYKKYFFTVLFSLYATVFVFLFIIDIYLTQPFTYAFWIIYIIFLLIYLKDFIKKVQKNRQKLIIGVLKYFPGLLLLIFGFFMTTFAITSIFGHEARFLGFFLQIIGISLLFNFYITLPPFSEFNWYEAIEDILIMNTAGLAIFEKKFLKKKEEYDGVLVGGVITSMKIILESITDSDKGGISVLEKKGKTIIIYQSDNMIGVIFSTRNLKTLHVLLQKFILRLESIYANILPTWDGELSVFEPVKFICDEIFKEV
ncbi:MAG: hypothetical protein ACFFBP_18535 [Promethearchaeota archaeon]